MDFDEETMDFGRKLVAFSREMIRTSAFHRKMVFFTMEMVASWLSRGKWCFVVGKWWFV